MEMYKFLKEITQSIKKYKINYLKGILYSLIIGGTNILLPIIMLKVFDNGIQNKSIYMTILYSNIFIFITGCNVLLSYRFTHLITILEKTMGYELRLKLIEKILSVDGGFFTEIDNGELYTLLYNDVEKIPSFFTKIILNLIKDILTLLGLIVFLSTLQWQLVLILMIYQVFIVYFQYNFKSRINKCNISFRESIIEKNQITQEFIINIFSIISAGLEKNIFSKLQSKEEKNIKETANLVDINAKNSLTIGFINSLLISTILGVGGIMVIKGFMSIGALITFNIFSQKFSTPITNIYRFPTEILDYKLSWTKIKKRLMEIKVIKCADRDINISKNIIFNKVRFNYKDNVILNKCDFSMTIGNAYAIAGYSGSGKSTLLKLILRLWNVEEGSILFDGIDIKELSLETLRNQIKYISQDIFILNDTVKNNLDPQNKYDTNALEDVLKTVELSSWFKKLENGLESKLGDNGNKLSGGEKQRLVLARAILSNPKILILDEATSMLDEKTEQKIINRLKSIFKDKILIIVTHRLKTLQNIDEILLLDDGRIKEIGTYEELKSKNSLFSEMMAKKDYF